MGAVFVHAVVSVDGFIADANDDVGPLFDWYFNGDHEIVEGGPFRVSEASAGYVRPMWNRIGATVMGRHLFDLTNGWDGKPPAGDHLVVVSHRPRPEGWHPEASCEFVGDIESAIDVAVQLAGDRDVAVTAGDIGGQALAHGLVDEVAMDVVPVVFGSGKRYFGPVDAQHLLEDPDVVVQGDRVLHLSYRVRRPAPVEELLDSVRDENADPFTTTVRVTDMTLRRKQQDPGLGDDGDDGGTAGVREPRRPRPSSGSGATARPERPER